MFDAFSFSDVPFDVVGEECNGVPLDFAAFAATPRPDATCMPAPSHRHSLHMPIPARPSESLPLGPAVGAASSVSLGLSGQSTSWTPGWFAAEHHYMASAFKTLSTAPSSHRHFAPHSSRSTGRGAAPPSASRQGTGSVDGGTGGHGSGCDPSTGHVIVALIDNRAGEVGLAACDVQKASMCLMQYGDNPSVSKTLMQLSIWDPVEILIAHTTLTGKLAACVAQCFMQSATLTAVHRREFNEAKGANSILQLTSTPESAPDVTHTDRYLCLASAHALLRFMSDQLGITFGEGTLRVRLQSMQDFVEADRLTARSLLMFAPPSGGSGCGGAPSRGSRHGGHGATVGSNQNRAATGEAASLADAVDLTLTPGGRRMLRSNILQPLRDLATIECRQDAVAFFLENRTALTALRRHLQRLQDDDFEIAVATLAHGNEAVACTFATESLRGSASRSKALSDQIKLDRQSELKLSRLLQLRHCLHVIVDTVEVLGRFLLDSQAAADPADHEHANHKRGRERDDVDPAEAGHDDVVGAGVSAAPPSFPFADHAPTLLRSIFTTLDGCHVASVFLDDMDAIFDDDVVSGRAVGAADKDSGQGPKGGNGTSRTRHQARSSGFRPKSYIARRIQLAFAVKTSWDRMVDLARHRLTDALDAIHAHLDKLREQYQVPSLKLHFDRQRECSFVLDACHDALAPQDVFVRKFQASENARRILCTTNTLLVLRLRLRDAVAEVVRAQEHVLSEIMQQLRANMGKLHAACDAIALLDMIVSFATFSATRPTARPRIVAEGPLELPSMHHMVCRGGCGGDAGGLVSSDVVLSVARPVVILTGPNASGKSTVLRSVAHHAVLAHMGCFLPVGPPSPTSHHHYNQQNIAQPQEAQPGGGGSNTSKPQPVVRQLSRLIAVAPVAAEQFAGTAATSLLESSFFSEMRALAFAYRVVDGSTLVLVDELGRGTSTTEGLVVAHAFVEWLSEVGCLAILATHMTRLTSLPRLLPSVDNQHMAVAVMATKDIKDTDTAAVDGSTSITSSRPHSILPLTTMWRHPTREMQFLYTIRPGPCQVDRYGLKLARQLGVHPLLTAEAETIIELLES